MIGSYDCVNNNTILWNLLNVHVLSLGALTFLMVWAFFLWMWSIPILLIEYGIGRYTRKSTVESFNAMIGPSYRFMGGFQAAVAFCFA